MHAKTLLIPEISSRCLPYENSSHILHAFTVESRVTEIPASKLLPLIAFEPVLILTVRLDSFSTHRHRLGGRASAMLMCHPNNRDLFRICTQNFMGSTLSRRPRPTLRDFILCIRVSFSCSVYPNTEYKLSCFARSNGFRYAKEKEMGFNSKKVWNADGLKEVRLDVCALLLVATYTTKKNTNIRWTHLHLQMLSNQI